MPAWTPARLHGLAVLGKEGNAPVAGLLSAKTITPAAATFLVRERLAREFRDRSGRRSLTITPEGVDAYVRHCTSQLELFA